MSVIEFCCKSHVQDDSHIIIISSSSSSAGVAMFPITRFLYVVQSFLYKLFKIKGMQYISRTVRIIRKFKFQRLCGIERNVSSVNGMQFCCYTAENETQKNLYELQIVGTSRENGCNLFKASS